MNYWPARTAMGLWRMFDAEEVADDFARINAAGFDSVRLFLTWEDFQSSPRRVDQPMVDRLVETFERALAAKLALVPTLFTGHMSGVNWVPPWAVLEPSSIERFRVVSAGSVSRARLSNWFTEPVVFESQALLAQTVARAVSGHSALLAWDLGNENSNCVIPPNSSVGLDWLHRMCDAIRSVDSSAQITLGLHMEDLEEDRRLGPREAAQTCDFLTMHGYPGYASFADGPTDERLLPFLTRITRWLGGGMDVLFSEFGVPTSRGTQSESVASVALVQETEASAYMARSLSALRACGATGAMSWCYADYAEALWETAPFDQAIHERSFGLWRADGSPKAAVDSVREFAATSPTIEETRADDTAWIDLAPEAIHLPGALATLYRTYCRDVFPNDAAAFVKREA